ncbi:PD-(D/E)XK nuclease family protein, partial [Phaeovulum sp.]|uniref:PD-(D/E)XK nuclease family protein n=1 Tax=Phaeovulum sp. TaxID=2934796 RepID=UPI003563A07B
ARAAEVEKRLDERLRLLYVAMTRAEKWLIVCAAGEVGSGGDSWYSMVADAMEKAGAETVSLDPEVSAPFAQIKRLAYGDWPAEVGAEAKATLAPEPLPAWAGTFAARQTLPPGPLSPSDLGGAKALAGEAGGEEEAAKRRGSALHLLLQHLPDWPAADWPEVAENLLATFDDAPDLAEIEPLFATAARILQSPEMAPFLGAGSLAEVEFSASLDELGGARVQGSIDRLVIEPDRLRLIDYKSNATVPATPDAVPEGILRQLGAYMAALQKIYPDRAVESAILWTTTGLLMPMPAGLLADALRRVPHLDVAHRQT